MRVGSAARIAVHCFRATVRGRLRLLRAKPEEGDINNSSSTNS